MYTQEIICPSCGQKAIVNVIDRDGVTTTPCQNCKKKIYVHSNKKGEIEEIKSPSDSSGGCFIATAVCGNGSAPEVIYLSNFRDNVLNRNVIGRNFVQGYYIISPHLATIISKSKFLRTMVQFFILKPIIFLLHFIWQTPTRK